MYDENKREFDQGMNSDEYKTDETTPNFIVRDSDAQDNSSRNDFQEQPTGQFRNSQEEHPTHAASYNQEEHPTHAASYNREEHPTHAASYNQEEHPSHEATYIRETQSASEAQNTQGPQQNQNFHGYYDQNQDTYRYQNSPVAPTPVKKAPKKKNPAVRKAAGVTAAALLFGTVAGATMVGINALADAFKPPQYTQVGQAATVEESAASASGESGGIKANTALSTDVSSIVEAAMPSVVAINNTMLYQGSGWFGETQTFEVPNSGSGIIVGQNDEELLIVTNNHVVEDASTLSVAFIDEMSVSAAIKGTDSETDLAVIAVPLKDIPESTLSQISVAVLGDSDQLKVGQGVIAIGNALGYGQSVTVGYVSALNREVKTEQDLTRNLLQTDAAINPGNSGGALLNMRGEVIGINAAKYSSTEVEGMGYAIPISKAQDIINNLMTKRTRVEAVSEDKAGYLGIQGQNVDVETAAMLDMPTGIFVYKILEGGAASKTDLREKDIITKFDDQTVRTMADLQNLLKYYEEGETVELVVKSLENGTYVERVVTVTLGAMAEVPVKE